MAGLARVIKMLPGYTELHFTNKSYAAGDVF